MGQNPGKTLKNQRKPVETPENPLTTAWESLIVILGAVRRTRMKHKRRAGFRLHRERRLGGRNSIEAAVPGAGDEPHGFML
jgi:hypothetical protein